MVNYFRAMAQLPGNITFDATKSAKAQRAALIQEANPSLWDFNQVPPPNPHDPPEDSTCYTADGHAGSAGSNLAAFGLLGPDSIVRYMRDSNTPSLGHRRPILYPPQADMGFGSATNPTLGWTFDNGLNLGPGMADTTYSVTVSGIGVNGSGQETYDVTIYDPATPAPRYMAVGLNETEGAGYAEVRDATVALPHDGWPRVSWGAYNAAVGETRPAWCDVDGDGTHELVLGLGSYAAGGGYVEVKDDPAAGYAHLRWLRVPWGSYDGANGETWPACGDVDGDKRDEIVVGLGLGSGGAGYAYVFDDATAGYGPHPATPGGGGWLRLGWAGYDGTSGETRPAVGNLDGDAAEQIVLGLAPGGGYAELRDDAGAGFAPLSPQWLGTGWGAYNSGNGETWPAVCDLNGDGAGEVVLGLGSAAGGFNGAGYGRPFDSGAGFAGGAWSRVNWAPYNAAEGAVHPACGNLDADPADELVLGLGSYPTAGGYLETRDDLNAGLAHLGWPRLPWSSYNAADGLTRPAMVR